MSDDDESDSLVRAVAAAPVISPPAHPSPARAVDSRPSDAPAPELVDTSALEPTVSGLRFKAETTEADYRDWHRNRAIRFTRLGAYQALFSWTVGLIAVRIARPDAFAAAAKLVLLLPMPLIAAAVFMSYRRQFLNWMLPATLLASMVAGFVSVQVFCVQLSMVELGTAATCILGFFGFAILRLLPLQALVAVTPYFLFNQWVLAHGFAAHRVDWSGLLLYSILLWLAFLAGVMVCLTIDLVNRGAYRQERIVAAQREVIDRLQRAELQRQVAERSRGLSEALSRLTDAARYPTQLGPGDVIDGRYKIVRLLGRGGMGQVHEVARLTDGRRLALKTLTGVAHREALARFAREAQVAAELDHPNVVAALDVGVTPAGTLFLVMELVAGSSLAGERSRYGDRRWAVPILIQVARALAAMHARGIVHRDLKPSNILVDGSLVKVADFGLAGLIDESALAETRNAIDVSSPALTKTGAIMGTPLYMAPELVNGARGAAQSADLFSFGVVAFEVFAKELPFAAPPVLERLSGRPTPSAKPLAQANPNLSTELCALVDRCLADAPEARPTAETLVDTLARVTS